MQRDCGCGPTGTRDEEPTEVVPWYAAPATLEQMKTLLSIGVCLVVWVFLCSISRGATPAEERFGLRDERYQGFSKCVGPGIGELLYSQQRAFMAIYVWTELRDPNSTTMFLVAQRAAVVERPEFWAELVSDARRSDEYRRRCLEMFFLRHLTPGDSLAKLGRVHGIKGWFTEDSTRNATSGTVLPVGRRVGEDTYLYQPDFMVRQQAGIYIRLSRSASPSEVLANLRGESASPDLKVIEVSP